MQPLVSEEDIYALSKERAIEAFLIRREAFFAQKERQKQLVVKSIKTFAESVLDKINTIQQVKPLYRIGPINALVLLRHRYDMHEHFPSLVKKIPQGFPSNCYEWDSDSFLRELKDMILAERDIALSCIESCSLDDAPETPYPLPP